MTAPPTPDLSAAWTALGSYDYGSPRGGLAPIDDAVAKAVQDHRARMPLERRLVAALEAGGSVPAREYICSCLALIGSDHCVPAVAKLLSDSSLSTAARNVLEVLPATGAGKALCQAIPRLTGVLKVGAINSLGNRREPGGVPTLASLLKGAGSAVACAAAAALGTIGDGKAARALRGVFPASQGTLRLATADAMLACASQLIRAGNRSDARNLCDALTAAHDLPERFHAAALAGIKSDR